MVPFRWKAPVASPHLHAFQAEDVFDALCIFGVRYDTRVALVVCYRSWVG